MTRAKVTRNNKDQPMAHSNWILAGLLFRRHPWRAVAVLLTSTAVILSSVGLLSLSSWLIAFCAMSPVIADILVPVVFVRTFGLLRGILRYIERLISHETTFRLLGDLRILLYRTFSRRPMMDILRLDYTDAFNRLVDDIERLQDFYLRTFNPYITAVFSGLLGFVLLARTGFSEALAFILIYGLAIFVLPLVLFQFTRGLSRLQAEQSNQTRSYLLELLGGLAELKVSGSLVRWTSELNHRMDQLERTEKRLALSKSQATGWISQLSLLATQLVVWIGSGRVIAGLLDPLLLPVEVFTVLALFEATQPIPAILQKIESSRLAAKRVVESLRPDELYNLETESWQQSSSETKRTDPDSQPSTARLAADPVRIELKQVNVRYPEQSSDLITDINLVLSTGRRVAVVGASGSGKTTLTYLLLGWLQPSAGTIEITPERIEDPAGKIARDDLFSVVNQDVYFFNTSILNNLRMGNLHADEQMIRMALDCVGLAEVIDNLPQGLDTEVGEGETRLSGGQRQRLAIARALLRPSPFLVLDEATAGIDLIAEKQLMSNLLTGTTSLPETIHRPSVLQRQGILTISHRLVRMEAYDEILVLDHGRIVERGTHHELLGQAGLYANMWRLQKGIIDEP